MGEPIAARKFPKGLWHHTTIWSYAATKMTGYLRETRPERIPVHVQLSIASQTFKCEFEWANVSSKLGYGFPCISSLSIEIILHFK